MDVSKLPRLSKTQTPDVEAGDTPGQPAPVHPAAPIHVDGAGLGADIWITVIVGLIFLALGRTFAQYAIGTLTHHPYHTGVTWQEGPRTGSEVPYRELDASFGLPFYSDSGLFLFGIALVFAAFAQLMSVTHLRAKRPIGWIALLLVGAATAYNVFVSAKLFGVGITPILSLLCVAFGGYEMFLQFRSVRPVAVRA